MLDVSFPGLWSNLTGGFENGAVVKVGGVYHLVTTGWSSGTYSRDIIVHFSSPDKYNWTFHGQIAGAHWENGTWYDPVAQPALYFNNASNAWEMFHIWCRSATQRWSPNCTCVRLQSALAGRSGISGPYNEVGVVLAPGGPRSQSWENGQLDSISNPFKVDDRWLVFIGAGRPWLVGLASSPNMTGPFVQLPTGNPVSLLLRGYNENPLVRKLQFGGPWVAVFDFLKPEVTTGRSTVFGFSYSTNGRDWPAANGLAVQLLPENATGPLWATRARTPLSLIDEGDGTYTMFYTVSPGARTSSTRA